MRNLPQPVAAVAQLPFVPALSFIAGILLVSYLALLAFIMVYGTLQMQFAQRVRDTSAQVGVLESQYLSLITQINKSDPSTLGFTKPVAIAYVTDTAQPTVSMRTR